MREYEERQNNDQWTILSLLYLYTHIIIEPLCIQQSIQFKLANLFVLLVAFVFLSSLQLSAGCVSGSCKNGMCSDIPSNNQYYLTSFCDKSVACGSFSGNCNE